MANRRRVKETSVAIGVPYHGRQHPDWWVAMLKNMYLMGQNKMRVTGIRAQRGVTIDRQRNQIIQWFLEEQNAEYLWFVDDDTVQADGAAVYLASLDAPIASGIYYSDVDKPFPIVYKRKMDDGRYVPIDKFMTWKKGQILKVDAVGAGALLIHRKVFLDMMKKFRKVCRMSGGVTIVRKDLVKGRIPKKPHFPKENGTVRSGLMREAVWDCSDNDQPFPFFVGEYGRTEDIYFFERAKEIGYDILVDTSVECDHIKDKALSGDDFRSNILDTEALMDSFKRGFDVRRPE